MHMRLFLDVLCNGDEYIKNEVRIVREVLLDIMTKFFEKAGRATSRMLWYALEHVEWLKSNGVYKLKEALFWGESALHSMPARGFEFRKAVEDLWRKVEHDDEITLYASAYAWQLVEFGKGMTSTSDAESYLAFVELAEKLMEDETDDDVVLCHRAETYSSIASGLSKFDLKYKNKNCEDYLKKAEEMIKKIKSKSMLNVAKRRLHIGKAVIKEKPIENLEKAENYLKELEKVGLTEKMKRYLKPLGGGPDEKFKKVQLREWHKIVHAELGRAYMDEDELDEAKRYFKKALDHSKNVDGKLASQSYLGRISVIEDYKFKWNVEGKEFTFKDLWKTCKENLIELTPECIAGICAEHLVSEIVSGEKIEEEELKYVKLDSDAFSLLKGIACLFRLIDKRKAVKELKNLELRKFELKIASANAEGNYYKALALEEIKSYVEELYNFSTDPSNRRDYEIRKRIGIEIWRERSKVWQITFDSMQALARIIMFYIAKDLEYAKKLAEQKSSAYFKLPNRLFKELADAIEREMKGDDAKEDVKKAFVKLFYLHV